MMAAFSPIFVVDTEKGFRLQIRSSFQSLYQLTKVNI